MQGLSEADKEVALVILAVGLLYVFAKVAYERFFAEKFTLFHIFHPLRRITAKERQFISSFLIPFHDFNATQKRLFLKRFAWFNSKMRFVFYGDINNKEELKAYVSASAVLLTMGMKRYQYSNSVRRVIIYPSKYYSRINRRHHLGEYNPRMKTLVFAADTLKEGFRIPNDKMNLGVHEFSHALCYEMKKQTSWESRKFRYGFRKLGMYLNDDTSMKALKTEKYLRSYGFENVFEFFAILTESFIENPTGLRMKHPKLHETVKTMYGFDFLDPNWVLKTKN